MIRPSQRLLFEGNSPSAVLPFKQQLLKWIGNKQRFAAEIVAYFPKKIGCYFEPFLGSGGVLGTLAPREAVASDVFSPLMEIWTALQKQPESLKKWYSERWDAAMRGDKVETYERIRASYNARPNGADLVFLCRSCYGGVVRFRKSDGWMSTPCGIHRPISPESFARRVELWRDRTSGTTFRSADFEETMELSRAGDIVYCDPPYSHSQAILYGAQSFSLERLLRAIWRCKERGVCVALSIDGTKKSGNRVCQVPIPHGLFEREVLVEGGRSMLKRFQMEGRPLEDEIVADRLLLTY